MEKLYARKDELTCSQELKAFIDFYHDKIGYAIHGEKIGCGFEDEETGKLTFNAGVIRMEKGRIVLSADLRTPVTIEKERIIGNLKNAFYKSCLPDIGEIY